jgi:hypothetical protein
VTQRWVVIAVDSQVLGDGPIMVVADVYRQVPHDQGVHVSGVVCIEAGVGDRYLISMRNSNVFAGQTADTLEDLITSEAFLACYESNDHSFASSSPCPWSERRRDSVGDLDALRRIQDSVRVIVSRRVLPDAR